MISFMIGSYFVLDVSSEAAIQYLLEFAEHKESVRPQASLPSVIGSSSVLSLGIFFFVIAASPMSISKMASCVLCGTRK